MTRQPVAALELTAVGVTYHRRQASHVVLTGVDLSIAPGEVVGIAGPSGSGKSTLLRLAAGLLRPTAGQLRYDGVPAWSGRRVRYPAPGHVGLVFQDPVSGLDPRWTIGRSVTEPLRAGHRRTASPSPSSEGMTAVAAQALSQVGLGSVALGARPEQLSVGQLQRVVLARALLARPRLLLADEPTSALDVTSGAGVLHLLRAFADGGAALLVVSHDRPVLDVLCDRIFEVRGTTLVAD